MAGAIRRHGGVFLVLLCCLAVGLAAGAAGTSSATAQPTPTAGDSSEPATVDRSASAEREAPCAGVGNRTAVVAAIEPDAAVGPNGTVAVHRGSEIDIHLCDLTGNYSLEPDAPEGLTALEHAPDRVTLRVDDRFDGSLGSLASPDAVPGPAVDVVGHLVETDLLDAPIPMRTGERVEHLASVEAAYGENATTYGERLDELAAATAAVERGDRPGGDPVERTLAARASYRESVAALRSELGDVATDDGGRRAGTTLLELGEREDDRRATAQRRLAAHDAALADRERSVGRALRLRIVGLGLAGLAVGAVAGAALPVRRGRRARRRAARGEWTTYTRRVVLVPAAVGLGCLLAGLAWLLVAAGPGLAEVLP